MSKRERMPFRVVMVGRYKKLETCYGAGHRIATHETVTELYRSDVLVDAVLAVGSLRKAWGKQTRVMFANKFIV